MPQWQQCFTLSIYTKLAAMLFCVSAHTQGFSEAYLQTLPAYAIASTADLLNSTICGKELKDFRDAIDQRILWSLKVLDSSGGFKSGFLYGNNYWLGNRKQCLDTMNSIPLQISERTILNNTLYRDSQKEFPPFKVNYFVAHFKHNSTLQYHINIFDENVITLGLCLPASCTINNISFILEKMFCDRVILINDLYFADFQLTQIKDLKNDSKWLSSGALSFICVSLGLSFLMVTAGTIYDIIVHQKYVKKNGTNKINSNAENIKHKYKYKCKNISEEIETEVNLSSHRKNKIGKILICFSAYTNTRKMFSTKLDASTIPVIHGFKFLSMCYIILAHSVYFTLEYIDNKVWLWRFIENYGTYITDVASLSYDTFFFSSGCLMIYSYLKNKKNEGPIDCRKKLSEFFINIIKRFIRLTPVYMIVLGIWQLSSAWFDKVSQFHIYDKSHETCAKYWWRNLLYINNLFDSDAMCMIWSWYLANDMQFYVIATMLLILSTIYFYAAVTILGALLIGSIILNGYISYVYEYVPTFDKQYKLRDVLYFPPWIRINPYIIGMIAGYILTKLNNNLFLKKKIIILCWCLASACNVFILFMLYKRNISILATAIYVALYRILSVTGIAWIVIACSTKHGGIVNQLLSFKGWIFLSRLTYCAYLLNPVIIRSICLYSEMSIHFEFLPMLIMGTGYIVISYFCSYALYLMVEIPCVLLMQIFI